MRAAWRSRVSSCSWIRPRTTPRRTIGDLAALGIRIKVITGDNRYVAAHVAAAIGLDPGAILTGEQIGRLRDESLWHLAERTDLFVEVDPQQKERIVRALQRTGHAVGYLGDGINDAPSLHAADVGISVEKAVDVARESADVVLLRHDLDVLRRGVEDGRATFANTLKYISITTSANFGNMVSMALATPLLPFLPLAAKQILLNNFLSDLPSIAISTDNVDAEHTARAQRWNVNEVRRFMIVFGLISTVFDLLTFVLLLQVFEADESDLPDRMVRRLPADGTRGRAGAAHPWSGLAQRAKPAASVDDGRGRRRRARHFLRRAGRDRIRLRAPALAAPRGGRADRRGLRGDHRSCEAPVLPVGEPPRTRMRRADGRRAAGLFRGLAARFPAELDAPVRQKLAPGPEAAPFPVEHRG